MSNFVKIKEDYQKTFFDVYQELYYEKFTSIDLALKSELNTLTKKKIAQLLSLPEEEVAYLLQQLPTDQINLFTVINVMLMGSSDICQMFFRELQRGNPSIYTLEDISHIYQLDLHTLQEAAAAYGKENIPSKELQDFFKHVKLKGILYQYG